MLVTVDDMRTLHGATIPADQEARWEALLQTAEEEVLAYAWVEQGSTEEHFPGGSSCYVLTSCPVIDVSGATVDGSAVEIKRFDRKASALYLTQETPEGSDVCVSYTSGWADGQIPATILKAIAFTASHLNRLEAGRLLGTTSRTTDGGTEQIEQTTPPLAVQKMLQRFRRNGVM